MDRKTGRGMKAGRVGEERDGLYKLSADGMVESLFEKKQG